MKTGLIILLNLLTPHFLLARSPDADDDSTQFNDDTTPEGCRIDNFEEFQ